MVTPYLGKIEYCYSNSTAMLLHSIGEQIDPSLIEVMTGMGIGAHMRPSSSELFFDCTEPDVGISRALTNLGFDFDKASQDDPAHAPFDKLREQLKSGPVVLGPLEFSKLVYNPSHGSGDSDHYVLAYDMDDAYVYIHDPWGFPCARITFADLEVAWRAEAISYKRGYFRSWNNPKRTSHPSDNELYERVLATCKDIYSTEEAKIKTSGKLVGSDAIKMLANDIRQRTPESSVVGFLTKFSLPLSAKRSLDYALFFKDRNKGLADIKYDQAQLFGIAGTQAVAGEWSNLADTLDKLADKEDQFRLLNNI